MTRWGAFSEARDVLASCVCRSSRRRVDNAVSSFSGSRSRRVLRERERGIRVGEEPNPGEVFA